MEQSLFFAGSFSRIGIDFRAILLVFFEDHILDRMARAWDQAVDQFSQDLDAHANVPTNTRDLVPLSIGTNRKTSPEFPSEDDYSPSRSLLAYPILAKYINAILISLNNLRLCTISSLRIRLGQVFDRVMTQFCQHIIHFHKSHSASGKSTMNDQEFWQAFDALVEVRRSFFSIYSDEN